MSDLNKIRLMWEYLLVQIYNTKLNFNYLLQTKISSMSKSDTDTHLRFGQGILIQGYKEKDNDLGFLTAKGFADIKTKYETYDDVLYFKNYRNAIFQILPAGNFQINDELHKAEIQNDGTQQTQNIKILKARAKSQQAQFNLAIESKKNAVISFGTSVIFKHIDSQSYISGTIRPSAGSNGAFTVEVSNNLSESLIFKLLPYRSFEFLGMQIPFDSPIILKNQFNNGFLTFQKLGLNDGNKEKGMYIEKKPIESDETYKIPVKTKSQVSSIYQCVTHFVDLSVEKQVPMPWKFVLQFKQVENDSLIQHDIVYLEHTENNGVLSMDKGAIVLKEMKQPPESPGLRFYQCLWEIEMHDSSQDAYILRHLMSGQTLGIEYETERNEQGFQYIDPETNEPLQRPVRPILIDISGGSQSIPFGVVQLKLAKKQGGDINSQSHINVAWGDFILQTDDIQQQELFGTQQSVDEQIIQRKKMRRLLKQEIEYKTRRLVFTQNRAQKHCFVIQEIDDDLKKDVLFALSFHSVIINLREDLKWGAIEAGKKIDYFRMMKVTEKIFQIKQFLKNCIHQEAQFQHIFPDQKRQMICKDLGISELLFQLLFYMKMNIKEQIFSDKHNERQKFMQLYNTIYQVIRELIRKNKLFKMHISKWIMFVFEDVINNNQVNHLRMLKELLEENQFFCNNFVTENLLNYLTQSMLQRMNSPLFEEKKFIEIFRLLCITGSTVNTANQIFIYNTFIEAITSDKGSVLSFKLKLSNDNQILIQAAIDKNNIQELPFTQFYQKTKTQNQSAWNYFVEYLNLIADMTQGRNKVTEKELGKEFTLELLTTVFENVQLYEAEVPVLRILHYLYAQSESFYPVERKKRIVNFNVLNQNIQPCIISTQSVSKPWQPPFNRVLKKLLQKISACGPIDPSPNQFMHNKTVYELLNFVWQTLNLGFWRQKEEVRNILESVKRILQKHESNMGDYEQVKKKSAQNSLMIRCKLQCVRIIELIADYDNDLFVQRLSINFKDFEMPEKKRGLGGEFLGSLLTLKADDIVSRTFMQTIPQEKQLQPLIQTNLIDQMIELANYGNPELTSKALSIIQRVLQTKKKAIEHFSSQRFLCCEDVLRFVEYIDSVRNSFFILEDPNMVGIDFQSQHDNYFLVYQQGKTNNLMTTLYNLSELMKNEYDINNMDRMKTLQTSHCYDYLGADKLINFTMQRSSTSQVKQYIVYCSNLHPKVLAYIYNCKQVPESQLALKLLHLCYKFIVALIQNFNQIKVIMMSQIPKLIQHIKKNVGCVDFLKQMYDNNKNMLYNQSQVFSLIKFMCDTIEEESHDSYYKSKLLDFFRYLIYCNGKSLKFIQIQILKIMQDDSYRNIMLRTDQLDRLPELVDDYERQNANKAPGEFIEMSPELTYMTTFFQISTSLIDDNNTVNMGKITKKFPFDKLVQYLTESRTCWPLKRNIRTLINRLYYFQPQIQTHLKKILQDDFQTIITDLNTYIKIKNSPDVRELQAMTFESPVRFSYLESYLYLNLEEIFFTIFQLVTRDACIQDMLLALNGNETNAHNFIRISERLAWIRVFFTENKNVYSNSMLKFIMMKIRMIMEQIDVEIFRTKSEEKKSKVITIILTAQGIDQFYKSKSSKVEQSQPLAFQVPTQRTQLRQDVRTSDRQKLKDKLRMILKREKRDFYSQDERITYYMNKLINSLKLSSNVTEFFFAQFKEKVKNYTGSEDIYNYLASIIQMNSNNPEALPTHLKVFFLELITFIVEESNNSVEEITADQGEAINKPEKQLQPQEKQFREGESEEQPFMKREQEKAPSEKAPQKEISPVQEPVTRTPIDQWQPQQWQSNQEQIKQTQNRLKKCQLSTFIVDLLKQNIIEDVKFANSILLCSISYLLGGNSLTQKSIIQQLSKDQENKVFRNIEALIQKLGKLILKNITENVKDDGSLQNDFCPTTIDNYDYFDVNQRYCLRKNVFEPNSTDQHLYHQLCIATYRRAFKFLQLLCENNNIQGKHFIREQPGKQRQINFINVATRQLRSLFQVMCGEIVNVPIFLLEFILEVTQIPIKENQEALMRSTFFEDLCQMQGLFSDPAILSQKNIKEDGVEALQQVYFKSVEIILSNFQGNDQKTFISLDSKLQPKFLTNILSRKLATKGIENRQQLVGHINGYCNEEEEDGRKKTTFSDQIMECLNIMIIFAKIKDKLKDSSAIIKAYERFKKDKRQDNQKDIENLLRDKHGNVDSESYLVDFEQHKKAYRCMYKYLQKCILRIEITDNNYQQQTVYFPRYPVFNSLSPNLRDYVMTEVQRSTHRDKIVSLLGFVNGIKDKIEYSYNLEKKEKITEKNMNDSYNIAAFISIIICLYMMLFYDIVVEYEAAEFTSNSSIGLGKFFLSLLQLGFSLMYTYYWYKLRIWYKPERESRGETSAPAEEQQAAEEVQPGVFSKIKQKISGFFGNLLAPVKQAVIKLLQRFNITLDFSTQQSQQTFYKTGEFWRIAIFVFCSFIGTFIYPITFFIHLIDIFCKIEVLSNIFEAVAVNIKSLLYVSFMGVVFVFVFCTVTFSNYMKNVYAEGEGVDQMCDDVLDCVMSLYVSGAISETMETFELGRFTYDMIYGTFFGMLFGNIVQGIMLDAFAGLREKNESLHNDKTNTCYICNMPRQMMEKKGEAFSDHTRNKHFLWNYVFYIIALQRKNSNDYTGLEYEISQKYNLPDEEMDVSWIPSKGESEFNVADQATKLVQRMNKDNGQLEERLKSLDERIAQFNSIADEYGE